MTRTIMTSVPIACPNRLSTLPVETIGNVLNHWVINGVEKFDVMFMIRENGKSERIRLTISEKQIYSPCVPYED